MAPGLRIATYNVAWFDRLFDDAGLPLADDVPTGRPGVARGQQLAAVAAVFRALDACAVMVIEAPDIGPPGRRNGAEALRRFAAAAGLRAREVLVGYSNDTQQEILLLYDPDRLSARHDARSSATEPRFDRTFAVDLDNDGRAERVVWSKPPLEAACETPFGALRLIGVHAKSKAAYGAQDAADALHIAIANRRKQLAQCVWLRRRVETHLAAGEALCVLGDFKDGPGLDAFERLFGRSGVEIVMGDAGDDVRLIEPHAERPGSYATARFYLPQEGRYLSALLDFVMVSQRLARRGPTWRIWHPVRDAGCRRDPALSRALLAASDHFPVTLDLPPQPW